jgi:serine/threonine-protein kinase
VQPSVSDGIDFDDETMIESNVGAQMSEGAHPLGPDFPAVDTYGKYEILGRLAVGGMAEVFLAREKASHGAGRHVAVKRILPQIADDDTFVEMFLDEARLAMRLNHPNICHIYDIGELEETYFIAMEWVNGIPFGKLIGRARDQGGMPITIAVKVMAHVADALNYAHQARDGVGRPLNIVHRDVSPQNVMVRFDGVVKLLDFGIAKAATQTSQTEAGIVKGKFSYMSPEQCLGKPLDARSDIFAIGACLYEALTGKPAFRRASDLDTMRAIVHEPVPSARLARADVPPRLDAILRKALAKDPGQRFQTAGEMYVALERFLAEQGEFVHAMHIANAIETLMPNAAARGPFGPDSNPSQKALQLESGSRPAGGRTKSDKNQAVAPESDPDLDTLDNQAVPAAFDIEVGEPMDEDDELPTEQWSGEQIPSVIKHLQAEAAAEAVSDDATTNVANPDAPGVPFIHTEETAALDPATGGPLQAAASQPPADDPFARPASFAPEPKRPSTLLRVSVVLLALCAAALVTVAIVWSTTTNDEPEPEPEGEGGDTTVVEETESGSTAEEEETVETSEGSETEELTAAGGGDQEGREVTPPPTTGSVTITTQPAGATVRMGDREGVAPVTWDEIEAGTHTVTASLDGHVDAEGEFVVEAGRPAEVRLTLIEEEPEPRVSDMSSGSTSHMRRPPPPQGTLVLDTQPRGTRVFFGRTALGRTPLRARLPVGTVRLRLVTPDGEDHVRSVRVRPSGESRAFLPLSR